MHYPKRKEKGYRVDPVFLWPLNPIVRFEMDRPIGRCMEGSIMIAICIERRKLLKRVIDIEVVPEYPISKDPKWIFGIRIFLPVRSQKPVFKLCIAVFAFKTR